MGWMSAVSSAAGKATSTAGGIYSAVRQHQAAADAEAASITSGILEAAFFDDEVGGIIAESARLVGNEAAEAGARGVKSTTGTAAARAEEIRRSGRRAIHTAAQETVLTRHGFTQAGRQARRAGQEARTGGILAAIGGSAQVGGSLVNSAQKGDFGPRVSEWVGKL